MAPLKSSFFNSFSNTLLSFLQKIISPTLSYISSYLLFFIARFIVDSLCSLSDAIPVQVRVPAPVCTSSVHSTTIYPVVMSLSLFWKGENFVLNILYTQQKCSFLEIVFALNNSVIVAMKIFLLNTQFLLLCVSVTSFVP